MLAPLSGYSVYGHFLLCTIMYLRVPIVPCSYYSVLLVYTDEHLYDKYLNNEPYENKSNQLKSQFYTVVYLRVPYVVKFLLCTPMGEMHIIE